MPVEAKCTNAVTFKDAIYVVGMFWSRLVRFKDGKIGVIRKP